MKATKSIALVCAWVFLSGSSWIERVQNYNNLLHEYQVAQERIDQLERMNAELKDRLHGKNTETIVEIENDEREQVETLRGLITSEE